MYPAESGNVTKRYATSLKGRLSRKVRQCQADWITQRETTNFRGRKLYTFIQGQRSHADTASAIRGQRGSHAGTDSAIKGQALSRSKGASHVNTITSSQTQEEVRRLLCLRLNFTHRCKHKGELFDAERC